jgi:hypothetical protein
MPRSNFYYLPYKLLVELYMFNPHKLFANQTLIRFISLPQIHEFWPILSLSQKIPSLMAPSKEIY